MFFGGYALKNKSAIRTSLSAIAESLFGTFCTFWYNNAVTQFRVFLSINNHTSKPVTIYELLFIFMTVKLAYIHMR